MRTDPNRLGHSLALLTAVLALASSARARGEEPGGAGSPQVVWPPPVAQEPPPEPRPEKVGAPAPAAATPPAEQTQQPGQQPVPPEPSPVVPAPKVEAPPSPDQVFSGHPVPSTDRQRAEEHSWFDAGHAFVGRLFFTPVVKLDRFFSDQTDLDPERAQSFARLRGGLRLRQDGRPVWSGDLLAQVYVPGVEEWLSRFRLVLSGISDTTQDTLTADATSTVPLARRRADPLNLELRFGAYRGIRSSIDLGAGVLVRLPPSAFTRVRYRLAIPIDDFMVARLSYQVFWRTDLHLGTRLTSALEWPVTPSSMVRLGGTSQVAQRKTKGIEYGAELVYSHAFTPTAAVALGADAVGASRSPVAFDKYRLYTRLRRDVLRRWLFFEVEPEVGWPWTEERGRYRAYAVTFRLEMQLDGNGAAEKAP